MIKNYFLVALCLWMGCSLLQAQKENTLCQEMQSFIEQNKNNPAPQEHALATQLIEAQMMEGEILGHKNPTKRLKQLQQKLRRSYWEKQFRVSNSERFLNSEGNCWPDREKASPIPNPDLDKACSLNIAVIVDQSTSQSEADFEDIKVGLTAFVEAQIGTSNGVRFYGMESSSGQAILSPFELYIEGNDGSAQLAWINDPDYGLFSGSFNADSWFTGFEAVESTMPNADLVLVISNGCNYNSDATIASANALKENGAHLFALAFDPGNYPFSGGGGNMDLAVYLDHDVMPAPVEAGNMSINEIATTDYAALDDYTTLDEWMSNLDFLLFNNGAFTNLPECVNPSGAFSISYQFDDYYNPSLFSVLGSGNDDYTLVSHNFVSGMEGTILNLNLISNSCTCEGAPIVIDIKEKGCPKELHLVAAAIPCCISACKDINVYKWKTGPCVIYNGLIARPFSVLVNSTETLTSVFGVDDLTNCASTIESLTFSLLAGNTMMIEGLIVFSDPDCTANADVELLLEFENKYCCNIKHTYNFLDCGLPKDCTKEPAEVAVLFENDDIYTLNISINLPLGTSVGVLNNVSGVAIFEVVSNIICEEDGTTCKGISLPIEVPVDCAGGINPTYNYTITSSPCTWIVAGNYCDEDVYECETAAQIIVGPTESPSVAIAVNQPLGTAVLVTDNLNTTSATYIVQTITCGPFTFGGGGGSPCNGIFVPIGYELDCEMNEEYNYDYTITGELCDVVGNFCDLTMNTADSGFNNDSSQGKLSNELENNSRAKSDFNVYPNPLSANQSLHFDFTSIRSPVKQIELLDAKANHKRVLDIDQITSSKIHHFSKALSAGIYFITIQLENGEILRERIVLLAND